MAKELSFQCFVLTPGGPVLVESLSDQERTVWKKNMLKRLSESMSDYYTQHPDEYRAL